MAKKNCQTYLLSDDPTNIDHFESHSKIAAAIVDLIENEQGGKSIALKGTWGSGKSTVIELIKKIKNDSTALFIFDAWSHEGDLLRRAFLEKLIEFLSDLEWINKKKWDESKKRLFSKIKNEMVKKSPSLSRDGKIFAFLTLLVPLGLGLMSAFSENELSIGFWVGLGLSLVPVIFILFLSIKWLGLWLFKRNEKDKRDKIFNFLLQAYEIESTTESLETSEPSSIEFERIFSDLLTEGVGKSARKKIAIVIDNLDRIDTANALKVWTTMRTFFDFYDEPEWFKNLWLIVPFDEDAIKRLWENNNDSLGKSFLEKTFQIEFTVAPPVLSDTRKFFIDQLKIAFPEHTENEFHTIYRIFILGREIRNGDSESEFYQLTPREIKKYINKIGALHRQWCNDISLEIMALYVTLSEYIKWDPSRDLMKKEFLSDTNQKKQLLNLVGEKWREELAALYLNLPEKKAIEILLNSRFDYIFSKYDQDELVELSKIPGFGPGLENYLINNYNYHTYSQSDEVKVAMIAGMLAKLKCKVDICWHNIWCHIVKYINQIEKWSLINKQVAHGILEILKYKNYDTVLSSNIVESISNSPIEDSDEKTVSDRIKCWLEGISMIINKLLEKKCGDKILEKFVIQGNTKEYISLISIVEDIELDPRIHKYLKPAVGVETVISQLKEDFRTGSFDLSYLNVLKVMDKISEISWVELINLTFTILCNVNNNYTSAQIKTLIKIMMRYKQKYNVAKDNLSKFSSHASSMFYINKHKQDLELVALIIYTVLQYNPELNISTNLHSTSGISYLRNFLNNPIANDEFKNILIEIRNLIIIDGDLLKYINKAKNIQNYKKITSHLIIILQNEIHLIPTEILKDEFVFLKELLGREVFKNLFQKKMECSQDKIINYIIQDNKLDFDKLELYLWVFENNSEQNNYIEFLINEFAKIDKDKWLTHLIHQDDLITLLLKVSDKKGQMIIKNPDLVDAIELYIAKLIDGETNLNTSIDNWQGIILSLDESNREILLKRIRNKIIYTNKNIEKVIIMVGNYLLEWKIIADRIDDIFLELFKNILQRDIAEEINWMKEVILKNNAEIYRNVAVSTLEDFNNRLKVSLQSKDDEKLEEIVESLNEYLQSSKQVAVSFDKDGNFQ